MTIDDIALSLYDKLTPATVKHLISVFGSAEGAFAVSEQELTGRAGLRADLAGMVVRKVTHKRAEEEARFLQRNKYKGVASTDQEYPQLLNECPDNPHVLYMDGDADILRRPMLSMVGTREATSYGMKMCDRLVGELAEIIPDLVIVSGLAFGIDVACHRAALLHRLPTIAVMASPIDDVYPAFHTEIAGDIVRSGGLIMTENRSGGSTPAHAFLARNRIVAGMSMGTVVVETPPKGGSLSTAQHAFDYNRSLMAVPGRATDWSSAGTNLLIKSTRAQMVCSGEDIAVEMGWKVLDFGRRERKAKAGAEALRELTGLQREVVALLRDNDRMGDQDIASRSGETFQDVLEALFTLECNGIVRLSGGKYELC